MALVPEGVSAARRENRTPERPSRGVQRLCFDCASKWWVQLLHRRIGGRAPRARDSKRVAPRRAHLPPGMCAQSSGEKVADPIGEL
eukprot:141365-Prorocentrum_lima.AAC.1